MTQDTPLATTRETLHVSSVAIGGRAVLIAGPSGAGKSDLALRLIDRGATLISDDYTILEHREGVLAASPPDTIAGKIEVRGLGILSLPNVASAPVALFIQLQDEVDRMPPEFAVRMIAGFAVREIALNGLEPSSPIKVELALKQVTAR